MLSGMPAEVLYFAFDSGCGIAMLASPSKSAAWLCTHSDVSCWQEHLRIGAAACCSGLVFGLVLLRFCETLLNCCHLLKRHADC